MPGRSWKSVPAALALEAAPAGAGWSASRSTVDGTVVGVGMVSPLSAWVTRISYYLPMYKRRGGKRLGLSVNTRRLLTVIQIENWPLLGRFICPKTVVPEDFLYLCLLHGSQLLWILFPYFLDFGELVFPVVFEVHGVSYSLDLPEPALQAFPE